MRKFAPQKKVNAYNGSRLHLEGPRPCVRPILRKGVYFRCYQKHVIATPRGTP